MTCETTGPQSALLPTPLRFRENIEQEKNVDHPTDRPTGIQSLLFSFYASSIHHSFIIPPPSNDNNDWPPDSVPSKGTTHSVRGSVNKKKKDGKKVDTLFFGISVPIHNGGLHPRWFCSPFGGREGRQVVAVVVSKQASKCQVSSVKCKRTGVVLRTCPSSLFPPSKKTDQRCPIYARR